ncbi:MAG TPA: 4-(cytidine 5'-diphospho)-2-C-methyl-D-erythritol kinase [Spirochaetota bacterium]|nr:4-(cytidine 5'-diphospho)-2-C-methyl-D-erythritol kinase [Spirochaetota bacterium]
MESKAFAKINLHLEVLNKRQDGYHEILSLMAEIGVFDLLKLAEIKPHGEIVIGITPAGGTFPGVIEGIPLEDNLIARATRAYCRAVKEAGVFEYTIEKNIPAGSGMGGGSADAAAALRLLNFHYKRLAQGELARLAGEIGADVPFCLAGGVALCRGIGERVEPIEGRPEWTVLVADMGIHVDTGAAYAMLGRGFKPVRSEEELIDRGERLRAAMRSGRLEELSGIVANDFEAVVFEKHPVLRQAKDRLVQCGSPCAFMTGSGSAIVGLFGSPGDARRAENEMNGIARTVITTSLARGNDGTQS